MGNSSMESISRAGVNTGISRSESRVAFGLAEFDGKTGEASMI